MIVVTGATGNTGTPVVAGLQDKGTPFRAMVRSAAKRQELEAQSIPAVLGDFEDPGSLRAALSGADKAFLVCTPDEHLVRCETRFIRAAAEAAGNPQLPGGRRIDAAHRCPRRGAALLKALTEPGFENRSYNLTGPEALTPRQMAEILSQALGRSVTYVDSRLEDLDGLMRHVGEAGMILRWGGTTWTTWVRSKPTLLRDLRSPSADSLWTVGDSGTLLHRKP